MPGEPYAFAGRGHSNDAGARDRIGSAAMGSKEIRGALRRASTPARDTRHIHELARALARERLHLSARASRRARDGDLLWSTDGKAYKVVARTARSMDDATTFEVAAASDADFLLCVFLEHRSFLLLGIVRVPWSMVEWLGTAHGRRWRLSWSSGSGVRGVAELL